MKVIFNSVLRLSCLCFSSFLTSKIMKHYWRIDSSMSMEISWQHSQENWSNVKCFYHVGVTYTSVCVHSISSPAFSLKVLIISVQCNISVSPPLIQTVRIKPDVKDVFISFRLEHQMPVTNLSNLVNFLIIFKQQLSLSLVINRIINKNVFLRISLCIGLIFK